VWIQDYGIPLHVWGDSFFKLVGSKLGVFLDFDYETASMARFDIARLKILTSSWAIVDTVIKVEVDGSSFNIWAVEERSNQRSAVVVGDGVEEEGSVAVPSEVSGEVADGYVAGVDNSGEDDSSGSENDGDVRIQIQHGEGIEKEGGGTKCVQVPKGDNCLLTCAKSTNICDTQRDILSGAPVIGCCENVTGHVAKEIGDVVSEKVHDEDKMVGVGSKSLEEREEAVGAGGCANHVPSDPGLGDPQPILAQSGPLVLGLNDPFFIPEGPIHTEEDERVSFISEPEDVLLSHLSLVPKNATKWRKHKQCSKFPQLGVPKCLQLVEAVQEGALKSRRRRHKGGGGTVLEENTEGLVCEMPRSDCSGKEVVSANQEPIQQLSTNCTANSGINLILEDCDSVVPETQATRVEGDRATVVEAAKLLHIQKEVGFTFEVAEDVTIKELAEQEECDRAKKLDVEGRVGDQ
jgi:hypothetical protein